MKMKAKIWSQRFVWSQLAGDRPPSSGIAAVSGMVEIIVHDSRVTPDIEKNGTAATGKTGPRRTEQIKKTLTTKINFTGG